MEITLCEVAIRYFPLIKRTNISKKTELVWSGLSSMFLDWSIESFHKKKTIK